MRAFLPRLEHMIRGIALATALMTASASTTSAFAFNAEGFQTGMTFAQVATIVQARGLTLRNGPPGYGAAAFRIDQSGSPDMSGPFISMFFCEGRLASFSHNVDPDTDYIPMLKNILDQHGNPGRVTVETQPWSGPGGGYVSSSNMYWYFGDDRITLSFTPEGRTGAGALRYSRTVSISYDTRTIRYDTRTKQCFANW
jgi:hypothetical protein